MDVNELHDFYQKNIKKIDSILCKVEIHYEKLIWISYYLLYIYLTDDLHQLCMLYYDLCKNDSFKIFCKTVLINTKIRIIKKIIYVIYHMSFDNLKKFKIYMLHNHNNYFKMLFKNYNRILFHIYLLNHFYNPSITNIQKYRSLQRLKNIDMPVPYYDIQYFVKKMENDIIIQNQADSINEYGVDY